VSVFVLSDRRGASVADMMIFVATLSVAAALLYPAWSVRDFRARVEDAIADVDAVEGAAQSVREDSRVWPTPAAAGEAPQELAGQSTLSDAFAGDGYQVAWTSWAVVDSVEAPPLLAAELPSADDARPADAPPTMLPVVRTLGAIVVHSSDTDLLAELQDHYTDRSPFVLDSMWILVLPERADPTRPRGLPGR